MKKSKLWRSISCVAASVFCLAGIIPTALAAGTPIANIPLFEGEKSIPPNVMVLMDSSESMSWGFMPDQIALNKPVQYRSYTTSACNSVYYNPKLDYSLPKDNSGKDFPIPSFNAAFYDYYGDGGVKKVDLATEFQAYDEKLVTGYLVKPDEKQPAYYRKLENVSYYNVKERKDGYIVSLTKDGFRYYCINYYHYYPQDSNYDSDYYFPKIVLTDLQGPDGDFQRQNFAIWYSYYRTRMAMMKSSLSLAFQPIDDKYRVGFIAVHPYFDLAEKRHAKVHGDRYQEIAEFDATQKEEFYNTLFSQTSYGTSPAREGLARVGRHYAGLQGGINDGMSTKDPVIDQCQRNYTIMTTDGYWNSTKMDEKYGPVQMDGVTLVGQQDGDFTGADFGLVPFGVYDGGRRSVGYQDEIIKTKKYEAQNCQVDAKSMQKSWVVKDIWNTRKITQFQPGSEQTKHYKKVVQRLKTSWKPSGTYHRQKQTETSYTKTTYAYGINTSEGSKAVDYCDISTNANCLRTEMGHETVAECSGDDRKVFCKENTPSTIDVSSCTAGTYPDKKVTCGNEEKHDHVVDWWCGVDSDGDDRGWGHSSPASGKSGQWHLTCHAKDIKRDVKVDSCTDKNNHNNWSVDVVNTCSDGEVLEDWHEVASCTENSAAGISCYDETVCVENASNGYNCTPGAATTETNVECTAQEPSAANGWIRVTCQSDGYWNAKWGTEAVDENSIPGCKERKRNEPSKENGWIWYQCRTVNGPLTFVETCEEELPGKDNDWVTTECKDDAKKSGKKEHYYNQVQKKRHYPGGVVEIISNSREDQGSQGECVLPPEKLELHKNEDSVSTWEKPVQNDRKGGSINSLADVAQYYYATNLREWKKDPVKWGKNLRPAGMDWYSDKAQWQHMNTYVIGLGVSGTIDFDENYKTTTQGMFGEIRKGDRGWPIWPEPGKNYSKIESYHVDQSIDDFWHTAINGRGEYFSVRDPNELGKSIKGIFESIGALTATGAGVAVDNPMNLGSVYRTKYTTRQWTGDIMATDVKGKMVWSANEKLLSKVDFGSDQRKIYMLGAAGKLVDFKTGNLPSVQQSLLEDGLEELRKNFSVSSSATLDSLVNYLRGQTQHANGWYYRPRDAVLGDFINSKPLYVKGAIASYADAGYRDFKSKQVGRKGMVYIGGNDGMLHAFYAPSEDEPTSNKSKAGEEAWAYVPREVMGKMYLLADNNYSELDKHRYFVDGTPVVADVYDATAKQWKTILVAGFNAGGRGYFALDITNPDAPKGLWETEASCADCDFGLSFGKPVISKTQDGVWTVFVTSGHNNVSGKGILFALDALDGSLLKKYTTNAGSTAAPAGLTQISAYVDDQRVNNTVIRMYGGDLLGNIWRFDINGSIGGEEVALLGVAQNYGIPQPITTAPALAVMGGNEYVVVGTGRLLHHLDAEGVSSNTIYSIVDTLKPTTSAVSPVYDDLRTQLTRFEMNEANEITCKEPALACHDKKHPNGWLVDLPQRGEHVNLDIEMTSDGILLVGTNQPKNAACSYGAMGRMHFIDIENAEQARESEVLIEKGAAGAADEYAYATDVSLFQPKDDEKLPEGCKKGELCVTIHKSTGKDKNVALSPKDTIPDSRMSWRELTKPVLATPAP